MATKKRSIYKLQYLILGDFNLNIYSQNIYEVIENDIKKHVLIIYLKAIM